MQYFFKIMLLLSAIIMLSACGTQHQDINNKSLILYSEVDPDFTENLAAEYKQKKNIDIHTIYELKADGPAPDIVLAGQRTLYGLKKDALLESFYCAGGDRLPIEFKDNDAYWYGAFYDPAVLLINQQFARQIGQKNLRSWHDLENLVSARIAVENLSNSNSTQNFLGAMATHMGESISLNYLWNINRSINQYAKFPFTPIRMTAVGDADIAITRQSYIFKYLENNFPAYIIQPQEGTPVNLYGAAIFKNSADKNACIEFIDWLITDNEVKRIAQEKNTGFMFFLPQGIDGIAANPDKLWLNNNYLSFSAQEKLTDKWLEKVRFSRD